MLARLLALLLVVTLLGCGDDQPASPLDNAAPLSGITGDDQSPSAPANSAPVSGTTAAPSSLPQLTATTATAFQDIPVTGTIAAIGGTFEGTLDIVRFVVRNGELFAVAQLTGQLLDASGNVIRTVNRRILVPVSSLAVDETCTILTLDLGPLDLNLLGLMVNLDEVHLTITADPSGGLLGQLLCAIANLLDTGGSLNTIANLLNQILAILG